jgi:hypothetical protein
MDERSEHRYSSHEGARVCVVNPPQPRVRPALLLDISKSGLSLSCGFRLEHNTEILVDLEQLTISCIVCYCREQGNETFMIGAKIKSVEHFFAAPGTARAPGRPDYLFRSGEIPVSG